MGATIGQKELIEMIYANHIKLGEPGCELAGSVLTSLRVLDEQDALSRYTWGNLPKGLNANLIERILYYRGRGMLFYMESNETFYFLPFALAGGLDVYGRYTGCTPIPFNGNADPKKDKAWIQGLVKTPEYDIVLPTDLTTEKFFDSCVILNDYSQQRSQTIIPRAQLQEPLLKVMSEIIPFCRTNMLNSTGVDGVYVQTQDEAASILAASQAVNNAALSGQKWVAISSSIQPKPLTSTPGARPEEYLMALQSLDNYRLSLHGLQSGGLFQKGSHMLQAEQDMNAGRSKAILNDGLWQRQEFCDIVNSIWGTGTYCEISESALNLDKNFDGEVSDSRYDPVVTETNEEVVEDVE